MASSTGDSGPWESTVRGASAHPIATGQVLRHLRGKGMGWGGGWDPMACSS